MRLLKSMDSSRLFSSSSSRGGGGEVTTTFRVWRRFTQQEVDEFCRLTGDSNPIHSRDTPEAQRCVPGAFLNAVVSGIIGSHFPGHGTKVLAQSFKFPKRCRLDVDTEIVLELLQQRKISVIGFHCEQDKEEVFRGEAKLLIQQLRELKSS